MLAHLLRSFVSKPRSIPQAIDAKSLLQRAESAIEQAHWSVAEQVAEALTDVPAHAADAHHIRAVVAYQRFDPERALALVGSSIALDPTAAHFHNTRGKILASLGLFGEATAAYERAMNLAPDFGAYFMNYALAKKFSVADMPLIEAVERKLAAVPEAGENRANFQLALGKALDDCGLYDRAFPYFKLANDAKFATKPYAMEPLIQYVNALRSVFDERFFAQHRKMPAEDGIRPIFIVGMPRSGSTLLESLLCRDPEIVAGGEQRAMEIVEENFSRCIASPLPYPHCLREAETLPIQELARTYRANLTPAVAAAQRFTDKYLYNFLSVGLIALLFPRASIVHIRRHPLDVCLSCYLTPFVQAHAFTYDIETLCSYYGQYEVIMAHWHQVLPGTIIDVEYRDLAEAAEETVGALRGRLELPALAAGAARAPTHAIQTASAWQARQPVYRSSLERWRNYRSHIAPFVAALRDAGVDVDLSPATDAPAH